MRRIDGEGGDLKGMSKTIMYVMSNEDWFTCHWWNWLMVLLIQIEASDTKHKAGQKIWKGACAPSIPTIHFQVLC